MYIWQISIGSLLLMNVVDTKCTSEMPKQWAKHV